MHTLASAGAPSHVPARSATSVTVAEYPISPYESFTATFTERLDGRRVCAISRIKNTAGGPRRSQVFEFSEHRAIAVASLVDELLRALATRGGR
jgi:hypothetical protein